MLVAKLDKSVAAVELRGVTVHDGATLFPDANVIVQLVAAVPMVTVPYLSVLPVERAGEPPPHEETTGPNNGSNKATVLPVPLKLPTTKFVNFDPVPVCLIPYSWVGVF